MSTNAISDATAVLSAMTPSTTTNGTNSTPAIGSQSTGNVPKESTQVDDSGTQSTQGNSGTFGKYNKQMLISNYLNRGKDSGTGPSNPLTKETTTNNDKNREEDQNKKDSDASKGYNQIPAPDVTFQNGGLQIGPKPTSMDDAQRLMEKEFCDMFGTSVNLPRIQKNKSIESSDIVMDDTTFARAVNLLNQINNNRQNSTAKNVIDLTKKDDTQTPLVKQTHSFTNSFKLPESTFSEEGITFDFNITPDAKSQSLPLYFHKNMQSLQGQLPLTIFNKAWQQTASDNHVDYKKTDKEVEKYRGHPYPGEWTQSRFEWGENMDNLIQMLREDYKFPAFADKMEAHKRNVIRIFKEQQSWVIAFKYDLTIRKSVFAVRNPDQCVPNPSLEPTNLVEQIFFNARVQGDLNTNDNPYMKGGIKHGRNPYSDLLTENSDSSSSSYNSKPAAGPSRNSYERKDKAQYKSSGPYGNYKGKNFNPNYKKNADIKGKGKEKEG